MPELPDVDHFRRVAERASGHKIEDVEVRDARGVIRYGAYLAGGR